jgi:hypothetical protein
MFIGAITSPRINQTLERGTGRLYPYFTSFAISFFEEDWLLQSTFVVAKGVCILQILLAFAFVDFN